MIMITKGGYKKINNFNLNLAQLSIEDPLYFLGKKIKKELHVRRKK